jgi:hypothetical protein
MALINTTTTGVLGSTFFADGTGDLTIQQNGVTINKVTTTPTFAAYMASNQTVSNATLTKLNFDTKLFDTANCYNISTYRFTPNVAGYYYISLFFGFAGAGGTKTGVNMPYLYHSSDGNIQLGRYYYSSDYPSGAGSLLMYFNGTTDYVEPYISQTTGGNGTIQGGLQFSRFSGCLVKAA